MGEVKLIWKLCLANEQGLEGVLGLLTSHNIVAVSLISSFRSYF